jgi:tubulin monoglycylase TTLL3/8
LSAWDKIEWRQGSVGLYGYDIMVDTNLNCWLIEVNKCPAMDYSTAVTARLVPRMMEDFAKIIIDRQE